MPLHRKNHKNLVAGYHPSILNVRHKVPRRILSAQSWYDNQAFACQFVYAVALYFLATGERLFTNVYARCKDTTSDGGRVFVGRFDEKGLRLDRWGTAAAAATSVASARNPA